MPNIRFHRRDSQKGTSVYMGITGSFGSQSFALSLSAVLNSENCPQERHCAGPPFLQGSQVSDSSSSRRPCLSHRRRSLFLEQLDAVFSFVDSAFSCADDVPEVAFILGATIVSPKVVRDIVKLIVPHCVTRTLLYGVYHLARRMVGLLVLDQFIFDVFQA